MPQRLGIEAFLQGQGPVLDVRSPAEFAQGHLPGAINLPLFSDEERASVGTTYKTLGRQRAVDLGLGLIGPRLQALGEQLRHHARGHDLRLYCWRGGMRSGSVAWLAELLDLRVLLLEGGYKAYRRWVLAQLERPWPIQLLGGRTGCGKTELLLALQRRGTPVIDLEGLAHHRGSSFGGLGQPPQPSNELFENRLVAELVALGEGAPIWMEAESAQIGRCRIPGPIWTLMQTAPVLEVNRPVSVRLERLVAVYGTLDPAELAEATERISRRLGPQRTAIALAAIGQGDWSLAAAQMLEYYDRCYDHELARRSLSQLGSLDLGALEDDAAAECLLAHGVEPGTA